MATLNANYDKLAAGYLFPEVAKRRNAFQERTGRKVMRLDIGDAAIPLGPTVARALSIAGDRLQYLDGFTDKEIGSDEVKQILHQAGYDKFNGYGNEQGCNLLRKAIADQYQSRGINIDSSEVFVGDGAKCDVANMQQIFGIDNVVAVQDPAYPVYVDTNVASGRTGEFDKIKGIYEGIVYMSCTEENGFVPNIPEGRADLVYLCSPNNPTSAILPKSRAKQFVDWAVDRNAIIFSDAAYSEFIEDPTLMRSIYEIEGAERCAIEFQSFSKSAGFTGVRLGWTVVPKAFRDGKPNAMWNRRSTTFFNGACNLAQPGGLVALLTEKGQAECRTMKETYMGNAKIIRAGLESIGFKVNGGDNGPYLWFNTGMDSWKFLDKLLEETGVSCTPGVGFGPSGAGYARLSAFALREDVEKAVDSIVKNLRM